MSTTTQSIPEAVNKSATGTTYVTGKISLVSSQQGLVIIGVTGGQNPGQYVLQSNLDGGLQTALAGRTNSADFWGTLNPSNGQINTFSIYSN
jgi:hypothetical protein